MTESEFKSNDEISDDEQQLIKLSLKKPNAWNWELTTSKSSTSIAFPTIQLYDENSETLLAVADEADFVASSKKLRKSATASTNVSSSSLRSVRTKDSFKIKIHRDSSTNEITVEPLIMMPEDVSSEVKRKRSSASSSQMVSDNQNRRKTLQLPHQSKTKRSASSSSVRSRSSILERISELKKDLSSTDESDHEDQTTKIRKRYSYRTCSVGTILVSKESFSNDPNRRRRQRKPYQESDEQKTANKLDCTSGE